MAEGDVHDIADLMPAQASPFDLARLDARLRGIVEDNGRTFDLLVGVHGALGDIGSALHKLAEQREKEWRRESERIPIHAPFANNGVADANGNVTLLLGGPALGRIWEVKRLVVGGKTLGTTASGTAEAYSSAWVPTLATPMSEVLDSTILASPELPNIAFYEPGQAVVTHPQKLWVIIRSATAAQIYTASGVATDYLYDARDADI